MGRSAAPPCRFATSAPAHIRSLPRISFTRTARLNRLSAAGKPTIGNILLVPLTASHLRALASWRFTDEDRRALATALQEQLGADRAYVEDVSVKTEEP